tara:strand:- start:4922 stop:5830 length:909 start_codon:yes stop_codon:yes gene_type:complete
MKNTIEKALQKKREQEKNDKTSSHQALVTNNKSQDALTEPSPSCEPVVSNGHFEKETFELDLVRLEEKGHISLTGSRTLINEEFREIKRKLISNAFGPLSKTLNNSNIIMVTSGRPSEGKTFTATNLALSIASEQDKTVLLVDADVLKPNVLNTLGLKSKPGLMEYLTGDVADIAEVLYPSNVDKLKIVPAGKSHYLSTELLASQKMLETIDEFSNRYPDRIVIIDSPPIIGITETAILANFAGQAVVVVEEGKAKLNDVKNCIDRLNPQMAIGFVVNKSVHTDEDGTGYYGYYGYAKDERN